MKHVRSPQDLALRGAPPAFARTLHVGRPNVGDEEAFMRQVREMFDRRWLTNNGPLVQEFERAVAAYHGVRHCVAMCNGTIALEIAIRALALSGDVLVPSYTFIATAHALSWQGIRPVFVDIDPSTHNLSPDAVRRMITPRTTGIIGVHLWGRPAPVDALQAIADEHSLALMFDSAHAFGCSAAGRRIGGFGRCEVLSFHATKVFNTFEGGAVLTDDDGLAETLRLMRNFGFAGFDDVIHHGTNGKLPEINAAMGLVNLRSLPTFVAANRERYHAYENALRGTEGIHLLRHHVADDPNYHYVVVEVDASMRDKVVAVLHAENVLARKYFWPGCHRMKPYRESHPDAAAALPATEAVADRVIVLPTGPSMSIEDVETVASLLAFAVRHHDAF
ncbi:aminotransferase class I/II-fold pyridoxal phosphate-dependent enzyme [Dokdonella fugitiva]|jgi:dTDP-4-amino-4,6-dideoxygalactose transaminase|uniref:aminotransferase class I/II-fold pyridoxal phosphate-dependent enzyme n=1 Tax=Dokdonella fugitiva TaxID=328517 RepID=UPI0015FD6FFC|nr:aminotransferase class I/II-fold pyridoxal phosphate-dependent enzyme [Dokdonella fugitiva]MBA8882560.1 dTDP-4-amino-4,6-dideoxygalactose transaminase [Dokdonella fugitiva]